MPTINNLRIKLSAARRATRISFIVLTTIILINAFLGGAPWPIVLFSLLPLLIFIPVIVNEAYKGLALLCFVTLMYFMVTIVNLYSPSASALDWAELVVEVIMFNAAMLFSRWKQYSLHQELT